MRSPIRRVSSASHIDFTCHLCTVLAFNPVKVIEFMLLYQKTKKDQVLFISNSITPETSHNIPIQCGSDKVILVVFWVCEVTQGN